MILLNFIIIIDIACTFAVIWFVLFMLLMYLCGEGLVSCKNLFPIQLYIYIDNKIIIKCKVKYPRHKRRSRAFHLPGHVLFEYCQYRFLIIEVLLQFNCRQVFQCLKFCFKVKTKHLKWKVSISLCKWCVRSRVFASM